MSLSFKILKLQMTPLLSSPSQAYLKALSCRRGSKRRRSRLSPQIWRSSVTFRPDFQKLPLLCRLNPMKITQTNMATQQSHAAPSKNFFRDGSQQRSTRPVINSSGMCRRNSGCELQRHSAAFPRGRAHRGGGLSAPRPR